MSLTYAKVVADSISPSGVRITTLELRYWLAIHAELMTHRVFSRNAASNRAIPTKTLLKQVWNDPAGPIHWGVNQPGMQARVELIGWKRALAGGLWRTAAKVACGFAWSLGKLGLHKQAANRVLMPFQYISVIVTSTDWNNFFSLRIHEDAQPEMRRLAQFMAFAMNLRKPVLLQPGEWHLPYVSMEEIDTLPVPILRKLSTARNARVSYLTHTGKKPSVEKDTTLHDQLVVAEPLHASPAEHVAECQAHDGPQRNFRGWKQYREYLEEPKFQSK